MGWPPVEKVKQRCINNRNGGQTRNSNPACCSLPLATQIIWKIFICFTLLKRKLAPDGLCLSQHRDRPTWGYKMWPRVQLSPRAASLGCWWILQSWKWNSGLVLGTTIQIFYRLFSRIFSPIGGREVNESPTTQVNTLCTLEFPTKLLTIAILCLCLVCMETGKKCGWQGSGTALCLKP